MKQWQHFLNFELQNNLFQYRDSQGLCIWDIFRYYIYEKIIFSDSFLTGSKKRDKKITTYKLYCLCKWLRSLFVRGKYLFFIASRNRNADGYLFDKNAHDVMSALSLKGSIIIESYTYINDPFYSKYDSRLLLPISIFPFLSRLLFKCPAYDFSHLCSIINAEYPDVHITNAELYGLYRNFYHEKKAYSFMLKRWKVEKVFFTQNGIQKGLIAACKSLHIPVYEFQHGIVNCGHMAYSYPDGIHSANVFLPDVIFSLSDFWFKDVFMPDVSIVPIGNDLFSISKTDLKDKKCSKKVLVVSSNVHGKLLASFIQDCLSDNFFGDYEFYFKLHPNQYAELDYYANLFAQNKNVYVLTDKFDIPSLLKMVDTVLLITSTSTYEGLQAGDKVCIMKRMNYYEQEHVFSNPNVYSIDTIENFKDALLMPSLPQTDIFFSPFNKEMLYQNLNE